jgi:type I restriction enzyme M protein
LKKSSKNIAKDMDCLYLRRCKKLFLKALAKQDETADTCLDKKGNSEPDTALRDNENVPLKEDIREYFDRAVLPHVHDAWIDESKTVKGYEINITKYFYKYKPLRSLEEIRADILELELQTEGLISEVVEI